ASTNQPDFPTTDAFAPPTDWLPQPPDPTPPVTTETAAPRRAKPHNLTLNAVMLDPQGGVAIINKRPLRVGQAIEGYTLLSISENRVTLTHEGFPVSLRLETPDLNQP
ncbi:MAG: hypothetical protein ACYTGQ_00535, partial [Planctomycetota bacterium]